VQIIEIWGARSKGERTLCKDGELNKINSQEIHAANSKALFGRKQLKRKCQRA